MGTPQEIPAPGTPERQVFSVSRLNHEARALLEGGFPLLWVEGELSNLSRPASGHLYFSLKDAAAQVRCALFRNRATLLRCKPAEGMQVLVRARVSLYEPRGDFQLIVEHMEDAGHGALQRAFEQLRQKLAGEGLFDPAHKKPLPAMPGIIGVVTSPSGAALRDILSVIRRRQPSARVILYPAPVQGEGAGAKLAAMIRTASARAECDVLIIARGGGSLEDLWAFNEEAVARAIHACALPIISGVGHEIDFTIADFVADARAPTPTAAAELVTPDRNEQLRMLDTANQRLTQALRQLQENFRERLNWCDGRLQQLHPARLLRDRAQRLDEMETRLRQVLRTALQARNAHLKELQARLRQHSPVQRLVLLKAAAQGLRQRLAFAARQQLTTLKNRLAVAVRTLDTVSPLATLDRGYAILTDAISGTVLISIQTIKPGQPLHARLADGRLLARVEEITKKDKN